MPSGSGRAAPREDGEVLWVRSALFALVLPGSVLGWVPLWLSGRDGGRLDIGPLRWLGLPLVAVGLAGLLWCIWDFGHQGQGTLAPLDPPKLVVRTGLYRLVRNPMYVSVLTTLGGEVILVRSLWLLGWAAIAGTVFHLFVIGYEEPALRRQFGTSFDDYCRAVPRWLPRRP
jgi:protein-S-isoprenylcysteine O-methyltransferase Ste14